MGIYDRDYVRQRRAPSGFGPPSRGGIGAMRMWSVNTWIIIICAGVFFIDVFLPPQPVIMKTHFEDPRLAQFPRDQFVPGQIEVVYSYRGRPVRGIQPFVLKTDQGLIPAGYNEVAFMPFLQKWLHFSTYRGFQQIQFWRFLGFQFLHGGIMHLLFNMIGLYFFGPLVEQYLGRKRYLAFYLLCGIFGALMYCLLNLGGVIATEMLGEDVRIRGLLFNDWTTPLIGASAGVFGVLMAGAYLAPRTTVYLFFFLPMRLSTLAYMLVAIALFSLLTGAENAGGEAGHLGGALAGFYFIRRPHHLHGFFDFVGRADPTSHHYRRKVAARAVSKGRGTPDRAEVDRILDKVHSEGLASLTEKEKRLLREASRE